MTLPSNAKQALGDRQVPLPSRSPSRNSADDARPRLMVTLVLVICAALAHRPLFPIALVPIMAGAAGLAGVSLRQILSRMLPAMGVALLLFMVHAFLAGQTPFVRWTVFGWTATVTVEGASQGLLLASRVLGGMSAMTYLSTTTQPHEMFRALRWMRVPASWVELATLTWRYVATLTDLSSSLSDALKTRLGYAGFRRSLRSAGTLAGALVVRSMDQALRTHQAMILRAQGALPLSYSERLNAAQWRRMLFGTALPVTLLSLIEYAGRVH